MLASAGFGFGIIMAFFYRLLFGVIYQDSANALTVQVKIGKYHRNFVARKAGHAGNLITE